MPIQLLAHTFPPDVTLQLAAKVFKVMIDVVYDDAQRHAYEGI